MTSRREAVAEDQMLLDRAGVHPIASNPQIPDARAWHDLVRSEGIDFATAVQYQRIRFHSRHAPFIDAVESSDIPAPGREVPRIIIIPGAFYRQYPGTGADGRIVRGVAAGLGWPVDRVEVPSLGTMAENAHVLASSLRQLPNGPVILVSLSKGSSDVCAALARSDLADAFKNVRKWLNLSGIVSGTELIAWLRSRPLRYWGVRALMALRRQPFAAVYELRREPGAPLCVPLTLPAHLTAIHVIGFPLVRHLSDNWARRGHTRLAPLGPNDGGGILLADCERLPGHVYPVWGADHYLRPPSITARLAILAGQSFPAPTA
jgi:hypothetical protein